MNWEQRIQRARKNGHFTSDDLTLASDFGTCAVHEKLGMHIDKAVKTLPTSNDRKLEELVKVGCAFADHVAADNVARAESVFKKINAVKITKK